MSKKVSSKGLHKLNSARCPGSESAIHKSEYVTQYTICVREVIQVLFTREVIQVFDKVCIKMTTVSTAQDALSWF